KMVGEMAWDGRHLDVNEFTYELTDTDIEEVESGLAEFKAHELDGPDVTSETFPLPSLGLKLDHFSHSVHNGNGLVMIRGLNPGKYSSEDNAIIFLGISSYIGSERGMQDNCGNMMGNIQYVIPQTRLIGSVLILQQRFHSDNYCDVVALLIRSTPLAGGAIHVASSWDIYNTLSLRRPKDVEELMSPHWKFESRGDLFPGCTRQLLYIHGGKVILSFSPRPLLGSQTRGTHDVLGNLTKAQSVAMQAVQDLGDERSIKIHPRPGDMIFLNNHSMLHARESFMDGSDHTRHIMRLWLRNPSLAWSLPDELEAGRKRVYGENGLVEHWELEP
ncbi:hypothetical protein B0T21DRAFT_274100, partial [Apiosordaria backusii]